MRKIIYFISIAIAVFAIAVVGDIEYYYMTGQNVKSSVIESNAQSNVQNINLVNDCMQYQTLNNLESCKASISQLKQDCEKPDYQDSEICKDPRIDQFLDTIDYKIVSAQNQMAEASTELDSSIFHLVNLCTQTDIPSCQSTMMELKQECSARGLDKIKSCADPRIDQIISKDVNYTTTNSGYFQDQVLSFIDTCSKASGSDSISTCATTARQVMSLCHSSLVSACNDDRLQQIANMGLNSVIISKIEQLDNKLQTVLDECSSKMLNKTECLDSENIINESCNGNLKPYFPICYDPRIQNLTR
ncbi:MAG: hypothetical protein ACREA5_06130 [Nitrosotalea sp.]